MEKVTVSDIRQILESHFSYVSLPKTDDELLKMDLRHDLEFDSLDIEELSDAIREKCDVSLTYNNEKADIVRCNPTIENYIELFE